MENIVKTVGLDLAKNAFHVYCADVEGRLIESKALRRNQVLPYFEKLSRCLVAMETCTVSNWWCRQLLAQGHDARLIPAAYVKPFVKGQKNDARDAEAICEAAQRPNMRFAPVKSEEALAVLKLHRGRHRLIKQRTMLVNHVRASCSDFGVISAQGQRGFETLKRDLLDEEYDLPPSLRNSQRVMLDVHDQRDKSIEEMSQDIVDWHRSQETSLRLADIPGVGPMTASYLTAVLGDDGSAFHNSRQSAASLGLVPRQYSTGGRQKLGRITKRGDPLLRGLFYEGAMAMLRVRMSDDGRNFPRTAQRIREKSFPVVAVEWAHRNARIAWSMVRHGTKYENRRSSVSLSTDEN